MGYILVFRKILYVSENRKQEPAIVIPDSGLPVPFCSVFGLSFAHHRVKQPAEGEPVCLQAADRFQDIAQVMRV